MKKLTFIKALIMPFYISPIGSGLQTINTLLNLVMAPISILVTAYFIDTALAVVTHGYDVRRIIMPLVAMAIFSVYGYMVSPMFALVDTNITIKSRMKLRIPFLEKRVRLEYKHIENPKTVDLLDRVWKNLENQLSGILPNFLRFFTMMGQVISYAIILLVNAPLVGAILIAFSVPVFTIAIKSGNAIYQTRREYSQELRRSWGISYYLRSRDMVAERNLFGYTDFLNDKFEYYNEVNRKNVLKTDKKWFVRSMLSGSLLRLLSAACLFALMPSVFSGTLTVGMFIMIQRAVFGSIDIIAQSIPHQLTQFSVQREYLKDVNEFLELSEVNGAEDLPDNTPFEFETLEFKNVSFTYPDTEKQILNNLSLKMEKGKHYAFVGANGAGKTTLTKLITRLYDNYTGEILLNDKPLTEYPLSQIKSCICALFQDFARYDITVSENVRIGKINGATEKEIDRALELSGFDKKQRELKNGKDTLLGKTHEGGVDLSGGQWQRLAFARAIISPAPIKILDEPTAALDPMAESLLYAQFDSISANNSTTIFISHRLASAKLADVIFVIDQGKVAEEGSHAQLMSANGIYAKMFESQLSWYL